jgi:two-component system chemotaxis response regulator CheY
MDGISLIKEIAKNDPDLKVLMCTGSIEKLQFDSRMNKGITVIAKPFDNNDFMESVSTALAN